MVSLMSVVPNTVNTFILYTSFKLSSCIFVTMWPNLVTNLIQTINWLVLSWVTLYYSIRTQKESFS